MPVNIVAVHGQNKLQTEPNFMLQVKKINKGFG